MRGLTVRRKVSLYCTVHGAGRLFGRKRAKQLSACEQVDAGLRERGVLVAGGDRDESPMAYRRLPEVFWRSMLAPSAHPLRSFAVDLAGEGEFDLFKD